MHVFSTRPPNGGSFVPQNPGPIFAYDYGNHHGLMSETIVEEAG